MREKEEVKIDTISIHKRNEVIRGGNTYSLSAQKLGNAIYHHVQLNRVYKDQRFQIPVATLREIMGLEKSNSYHSTIKNAVQELAAPITLYNIDKLTGMSKKGQNTLWQQAQFLIEPKMIKKGKEMYIDAQMSPTIRVLIASSNEGNFTQLVLNTHLNQVKSKHSYVLYEYLQSFNNFKVLGGKVELSQERLDKMFNMEHNKKYIYFSSFKQLLERCVKDLNENTDMALELIVDKPIKKYYIYRIKQKEAKAKEKRKEKSQERGYDHPLGQIATDTLKKTQERGEHFRDLVIDVDVIEAEVEHKE